MKTLYHLTDEAVRLAESLEACEGDLSKVEGLEELLDRHAADVAEKLDAYLAVMKTLEMEAAAAKAEEEQWAAKRKSREARVAFLKDRLKQHLEATGQTQVRTATGRVIALQANGGALGMEIAMSSPPADTPEQYVTVTRTWNKDALREALGCADPEVQQFARLLPRGCSLRIR